MPEMSLASINQDLSRLLDDMAGSNQHDHYPDEECEMCSFCDRLYTLVEKPNRAVSYDEVALLAIER